MGGDICKFEVIFTEFEILRNLGYFDRIWDYFYRIWGYVYKIWGYF